MCIFVDSTQKGPFAVPLKVMLVIHIFKDSNFFILSRFMRKEASKWTVPPTIFFFPVVKLLIYFCMYTETERVLFSIFR